VLGRWSALFLVGESGVIPWLIWLWPAQPLPAQFSPPSAGAPLAGQGVPGLPDHPLLVFPLFDGGTGST